MWTPHYRKEIIALLTVYLIKYFNYMFSPLVKKLHYSKDTALKKLTPIFNTLIKVIIKLLKFFFKKIVVKIRGIRLLIVLLCEFCCKDAA